CARGDYGNFFGYFEFW
nr:immunoglobulin heavy chain junction region [Macaca mulatta]